MATNFKNKVSDFAGQVGDIIKQTPLSDAQLAAIASKYDGASPVQSAAITAFLQNNLSEDRQSQVLDYLQSKNSPASTPNPIGVDTNLDVPATVDVKQYGIDTQDVPDLTATSGSLGSLNMNDQFDALIKEASDVTSQFLKGELSPSSVAQLETISGEKSLSAGLGTGSASRNLTARDLGMTTEQLQQQGLTAVSQIAPLIEGKRQFNVQMQNSIDTFNKNFGLQQAQFQNQVRDLGLKGVELQQQQDQFNAQMALELNKLIVDVTEFGQNLQFQYATTKGVGGNVDTSGLQTDISSITADLSSLLG